MSDLKFSVTVGASKPEENLSVSVLIDNVQIFASTIKQKEHVEYIMPDCDGEHELQIILSGKLPEHTTIDSDGNIVDDAVITIDDIQFDGIDCNHLITNTGVYVHNFNGTGSETESKFYGTMGCNGTLSVKFTTPIYMWILENM